ncbi:MAG: cell division protein, partial [Oscillospiraceae bacterium]|nr:cell division protein [Oscillospiraceae bacterium]
EAEAKRDQLMAQAEADARQKIGAMQAEVTATQERLRSGQQDLRTFIASVREVCERELALLEQLPELPVEAEAPAAEPAAQEAAAAEEIEQSVFAAMQAEDAKAEQAEAPAEEPAPDYPEGNPFETESVDEPTRRIDLKDLKFGRNYSSE